MTSPHSRIPLTNSQRQKRHRAKRDIMAMQVSKDVANAIGSLVSMGHGQAAGLTVMEAWHVDTMRELMVLYHVLVILHGPRVGWSHDLDVAYTGLSTLIHERYKS